jgi:hypothetical protein
MKSDQLFTLLAILPLVLDFYLLQSQKTDQFWFSQCMQKFKPVIAYLPEIQP